MPTSTTPQVGTAGAVLRAMRDEAGMTLRGLAKAAEVDPSHLLRIEAGERIPSQHLSVKLAKALAEQIRSAA